MPRKRKALKMQGRTATIYIYDDISNYWGFSATELSSFLQDAGADTPVEVHINSNGGEVFEGLAIYNLLRGHKGKVTTIVDGLAASIASIIFLAGQTRIINTGGMVMIHHPLFQHLEGNSEEIEKDLELLKKTEETITNIYVSRTGQDKESLVKWQDAETYFTAEEALANGFATEIQEILSVEARGTLRKLVATLNKKAKTMEFQKWLEAYCAPLGVDVKKLSAKQKQVLKKKFQEEQKPQEPVQNDPVPNDLVQKNRDMVAQEVERTEQIESIAAKFHDIKLNESYVKDLGTKATTARGLAAHAIRAGWTPNDFELHLHRAKFQDVGHIGIHVEPSPMDMKPRAMSAALCRAAGVPMSKTHKWSQEKYGLEHWFKEEELEASDHKNYRNLGLHQMFDMAIYQATGSRYTGRYNTDGFIQAAREALWKLKMEGATTWTGLDIFEDAANKMLWAAYNAQETTWQEWVNPISVSDFKTYNMYRMTIKGGYNKVGADGELKHGGFSDDKYTVSADTFGKIVGLTRRDIINDDLNALNRIMSALGTEGARFLEELFYGYFLNVRDTLFPSAGTYNNYMDGASSALGVDALTTAEQLFADQVDSDNAPLLVNSEIILTGTALSITANEIYKQISLDVLQTANTKGRPNQNPHVGKWRPVVSPYINNTSIKQRTDALNGLGSAIPNQSSTQWWLLPRPTQAMGSVIVGAFLNGSQRPTVEQGDPSFDVLGLRWRAYHDAGVGSGDPKLAVYSKGAA